jgi:hypothetical protein
MRLAQLQGGNVEEQTLATVLDRLQRLSHATDQINDRLQRSERREQIADVVTRTSSERLSHSSGGVTILGGIDVSDAFRAGRQAAEDALAEASDEDGLSVEKKEQSLAEAEADS